MNQDPNFDPELDAPSPEADSADSADTQERIGTPDRVSELEAELAATKDEMLRERADIVNRTNRLNRDMELARRFANEKLLADLLPVFDALEAGLSNSSEDGQSLRQGMELTYRELLKVADNHGLKAVDPTGQPFNPEHHQAIQMVDSDAVPAGHVINVFQKGWVLNDRLLRPAMVVVRNH